VKARLEETLHELLCEYPAFTAELEKLLEAKKSDVKEEAHATNSKVVQVGGNQNRVNIGKPTAEIEGEHNHK